MIRHTHHIAYRATMIMGVLSVIVGGLPGCNDFLDESPTSQIDAASFYEDLAAAEIGLTGCYNNFFNEHGYPYLALLVQVSTDDIKQPAGDNFSYYKRRDNMLANDVVGAPWEVLYETVANTNFLLQEVALITTQTDEDRQRKNEILAEAHFIRALTYYYLCLGWGDVPLITEFPENVNDLMIGQSPREEVLAFAKQEWTLAAANLPDVITSYSNDDVTNQRKGRASKWAAKAYLARLALQEGAWQNALTLSNEIIACALYPLTADWKTIFKHPMNASESIFEQQNDFSPGFFGTGYYGWFFLYDFEWADDALAMFERPEQAGVTRGKDVRFELSYTPRPNKYFPPRGYEDGGVESANLTLIRLSEVWLNKAEALNELDFNRHKETVVELLNQLRARTEDPEFVNENFTEAPVGTTGIAVLDVADMDTQETLRQAIRQERRRELMFEDVLRWVDLYRWDKEYLKTVVQAPTDDHLFWPVPPTEILRNNKLIQNPAYPQ